MRYSRQNELVNQDVLKDACVAVVGIGGLGNTVATQLALVGVGKLILIDKDIIEESNLNRQFLFSEKDIGKKKIKVVKQRIQEMNPHMKIETSEIFSKNLIKTCDVVADCLDNWKSREELWKISKELSKPVVHGGIEKLSGQVGIFFSGVQTKLFKNKKQTKKPQVLGATAALIGSQMAISIIDVLEKNLTVDKMILIKGDQMIPLKVNHIKKRAYNFSHTLIRISSIWLKSRLTRKKMMDLLKKKIRQITGKTVYQKGPRLMIEKIDDFSNLTKIFGIKSISPCKKIRLENLEEEFEEFSTAFLDPEKTFRVTVKRSSKNYPKTSQQLQVELGSIAYKTGARVDLENPDINLHVEINENYALLFNEIIKGPDGYPYGVQGKGLCLFSGGIDSPVSAWYAARKGVEVDFLFLNSLGPALESKVNEVFVSLRKWFPNSKLKVIDVSEYVNQISENVTEGYRQTIYKRFMYKVAEKVAERVKAQTIITGESLGQVSSQTLTNLALINKSTQLFVSRPLIGFTKEEIINVAKSIGTFEASSKISEFCSLENHSNVTPREKKIVFEECKLDFDFEKIVDSIRDVSQRVIDLIPKDETVEIVCLWKDLPKFNKEKKYLFICKSGNKAAEVAYKMRKEGFSAFALTTKKAKKMGYLSDDDV